MIALICPTRGRPEKFRKMLESANATVTTKIQYFSASNDSKDTYVENHFPQDCPTVFMWNKMADEAMKKDKIKLFMLAADDMVFATPGWDIAILEHYERTMKKSHVYHLQDSRDSKGTPHPIVTREYINAMGYFVPPLFMHWFVDTWTRKIAESNSIFTYLNDYLLIHDKSIDKGNADETHNHIRRMGWLNRDESVDKSCQHFLNFEKQRLASVLR